MIVDYILILFFTVTALWMGWVFLCHEKPTINNIAVATMMCVLATGTYWSIQEYKGYPTDRQLGKNHIMLWADIQQPTETSDGIIYIWTLDPERGVSTVEQLLKLDYKNIPRAYSIPFTEKTAREVQEGLEKIKQGIGVTFDMDVELETIDGEEVWNHNLEIKVLDPYQILRKNSEE